MVMTVVRKCPKCPLVKNFIFNVKLTLVMDF